MCEEDIPETSSIDSGVEPSQSVIPELSNAEQLLQVSSRENDPLTWAELQFVCGIDLQRCKEGDRKVQLVYAIAHYDAAIAVYVSKHLFANQVAVLQYKRTALSE